MPDVPLENPLPTDRTPWRDRALAAIAAIAIFICFLFLYTRSNTFPSRYHPDEEGKARQILSDYRNFRHPQLLLEASSLVIKVADIDEQEPAVVAGRWVSASFAAGSVVALALIAYLDAGLPGMLIAAAIVGLCPYLFLHAHYMKEDTALVLGLSLFLLAARMIWQRWISRWPEYFSVVLLGAACAIATSGKYIGAFTIPIALIILCTGRRWRWSDLLLRPVLFFIPLLGLLYFINYRAIQDMPAFSEVFEREAVHPLHGHYGHTMNVPSIYFLTIIARATPAPILLLTILAIASIRFTWQQRRAFDWFLLIFLAIQIAMLCCCRAFFPRYALPVVVCLHLLAALGLIWSFNYAKARFPALPVAKIFGAIVILCTLALAYGVGNALYQMNHDSRDRVREFLMANTKDGDSILADSYAGFFRAVPGGGQTDYLKDNVPVQGAFYAANYGDTDALKNRGYTHVVVSALAFDRYFNHFIVPEEGSEDEFETIKHNYQDLFDHAELIWSSNPNPDLFTYVNPEIRVYRLK